ncbi:VWA domain-containing protein [Sinomicrobium oceani]|uniref:VWA domain-containing protein n=1 Tax=Sinomicrobium oceani TaxID=1150368 RepID=UPI00227CA856|nr:VWA domain-containing protein [Sinomicrobium oceani]
MSVIYLIIAGVVALLAALWQYRKAKGKSPQHLLFVFLRFLSVYAILLLLINPEFRKITVYEEKPELAIVADNSSSIPYLNQQQQLGELLTALRQDKELAEKFSIHDYTFGTQLRDGGNNDFKDRHTDLSQALKIFRDIYRDKKGAVIMLTDGNQTYGEDYTYTSRNFPVPVYPVVLGDTTIHEDLRISRLNVNRYAYYKNKFPVEVILNYEGKSDVQSVFRIRSGNNTVFSRKVNFSEEKRSEIIEIHLDAATKGSLTFHAELVPLDDEKNTRNNIKEFGIEVIDQKTEVLIVSAMTHPDIGTLKKSIESNEERNVTISKPELPVSRIDNYQLVILYQPNTRFEKVMQHIEKTGKNTFIISGIHTDWDFLNKAQHNFTRDPGNFTEEAQGSFNASYPVFALDDIGFSQLPPLRVLFGDVAIHHPYETILFQQTEGIATLNPLLLTTENNHKKTALLLGEDLWKWRMQDHLKNGNADQFDKFVSKLVFYLASNKKRDRLETAYETIYDGTSPVVISAQFFDNNYVFNPEASLHIRVTDKEKSTSRNYPMLLRGNYYEADLSDLEAGAYTFGVRVDGENIQHSGQFRILEFDVEQQYTRANAAALRKLAGHSGGMVSYQKVSDSLYLTLTRSDLFKPVQKSKEEKVPLVDWRILLFIIILLLSAEWFLRKYRGLI